MKRMCIAMLLLAAVLARTAHAQTAQSAAGTPPHDAADPAETQALTAVFPALLRWQLIAGGATELRTRQGVLGIARGEQCPGTREPILYAEIRLDGEPVETLGCTPDGDYYIVRFKNVFELGARDVVVLGADAGGSGSPPQRLHLIVLDPNGMRIEQDPAFRSVDGTERVAADGERLWFDLGYDGGRRKIATYDGIALEVTHRPMASTPVPAARCEELHRALVYCIQSGRNRDLTDVTLREFVEAPWSMSNASRRGLRDLLERPGFRADAYMQACRVAAETGESPNYTSFDESVCAR